MSATGTATVDFTSTPSKYATAVVTGQTGITGSSVAEAWIMGSTTADHSADEHIMLAQDVVPVCGNIVAGTGFTIYLDCYGGPYTGQFTVKWVWA